MACSSCGRGSPLRVERVAAAQPPSLRQKPVVKPGKVTSRTIKVQPTSVDKHRA